MKLLRFLLDNWCLAIVALIIIVFLIRGLAELGVELWFYFLRIWFDLLRRWELSQLKSIKKAQSEGNSRKLIKAMKRRRNPEVRKAAATALAEIGDTRAVESLINRLQNDNSLSVRLSCYSSVEQITGHPVGREAQSLIEFTVKELERLYSRQREEAYGHWEQSEEPYFSSDPRHSGSTVIDIFVEDGKGMVPDPDYNAIRGIVKHIPPSLHERVKSFTSNEGLRKLIEEAYSA